MVHYRVPLVKGLEANFKYSFPTVYQSGRLFQVEGFMTAREVAKRLGVTKSLVERWIRKGLIKAERAERDGGLYLIAESEFERFAAIPRHRGRPSTKG